MELIKNILIGVVLGVANIVPGVSGGTMAVILNVYDKLLNAISLNLTKLKRNIVFLGSIAIGAGLGIITFSKALQYLYDHHTMPTNFFFIGIIIGSIPMITRHIKEGKQKKRATLLPFIIAFAIMVVISIYSPDSGNQAVVTTLNVPVFIWLLIASAVSAFAMIIPGISGSFIMLILGAYTTVINTISEFNILMMVPIGIGCILGLGIGTNIVKKLLKFHEKSTYLAILGLIIGSIFSLYPGFNFNIEGLVSILLVIIGGFMSYYFSK